MIPFLSPNSLFNQSKLQYCSHLMQRVDSLGKTLLLGKIEGRRRRGDQGWDGLMASPTQWTWVWASSRSWWQTGKHGVLQSMGSQRVGHNWVTELTENIFIYCKIVTFGLHTRVNISTVTNWVSSNSIYMKDLCEKLKTKPEKKINLRNQAWTTSDIFSWGLVY